MAPFRSTGGTCSSSHCWNTRIFSKVAEPGGYTMKYEYLVGTLREKSRTSRPDAKSASTSDAPPENASAAR
jgi:hypothetical protein